MSWNFAVLRHSACFGLFSNSKGRGKNLTHCRPTSTNKICPHIQLRLESSKKGPDMTREWNVSIHQLKNRGRFSPIAFSQRRRRSHGKFVGLGHRCAGVGQATREEIFPWMRDQLLHPHLTDWLTDWPPVNSFGWMRLRWAHLAASSGSSYSSRSQSSYESWVASMAKLTLTAHKMSQLNNWWFMSYSFLDLTPK